MYSSPRDDKLELEGVTVRRRDMVVVGCNYIVDFASCVWPGRVWLGKRNGGVESV